MKDYLAKFLISCVSISNLIETRIDNMQRLHRGLKKLGISGIREYKEGECPLAYPLRVNNRDAFRHYLMENRIYCAVHWPFDGFKAVERQNAIKNANSIISLPIDQRYGAEEIDYLLNVIEKYGGELTF
jgi:dTDP-4-amino-4,6-dideoxygalactose transaminase